MYDCIQIIVQPSQTEPMPIHSGSLSTYSGQPQPSRSIRRSWANLWQGQQQVWKDIEIHTGNKTTPHMI
jgi:hypothetical protein